MNRKLPMSIQVQVSSLDELKGLLPDIAALQDKYEINLTINYTQSMSVNDIKKMVADGNRQVVNAIKNTL